MSAITRSTSVIRVKRAASACSRSFCGGIPAVRQAHQLGAMAVLTEPVDEPFCQPLGTPADERDLGIDDRDPHQIVARRSPPVNAATTAIPRPLPRRRQRLDGAAARASDPIAQTLGDGKRRRGLTARLTVGRPKRVEARCTHRRSMDNARSATGPCADGAADGRGCRSRRAARPTSLTSVSRNASSCAHNASGSRIERDPDRVHLVPVRPASRARARDRDLPGPARTMAGKGWR